MTVVGQEVARLSGSTNGLEDITNGGLPKGRLTLAAGTAGSGKTIFAVQFLATGIEVDEPGVFVTFEERPSRIRADMRGFGWDIETWEREGRWAFVDASPDHADEIDEAGRFDLSPLVARIRHAVEQTNAKRVAIDSIGALVTRYTDRWPARRALFQVGAALEEIGVSTLMTAERPDEYGPVAIFGFEEFLADCVLLLRNTLVNEKRRRTIEVLKIRGGSHKRGEHLFTLQPGLGAVVVPKIALDLAYASSTTRVTSGNTELDEMLSGGMLARSLALVTGATGTGKSLLSTQFIAGGAAAGERTLMVTFEESREQLVRNAQAWGIDLEELEAAGTLRILAEAPESKSLEDHLLQLNKAIQDHRPDRIAIDSLSALQRASTAASFRDYILGIAFEIKSRSIVGLFTASNGLMDNHANGLTDELHFSTVVDTIILLQYVGIGAEMRRGMTVLKMRGSDHDKSLHEYWIDDGGLHVGDAFRGVTGLLVPTMAEGSGRDGRPEATP